MRRTGAVLAAVLLALGVFSTAPVLADELAESWRGQGIEALKDGRLDEALECFKEALSYWAGSEDPAGMAQGMSDIGYVYERRGDGAEAASYYHAALGLHLEVGGPLEVALDLYNLARAYDLLGHPDKAEVLRGQAAGVLSGTQSFAGLRAAAAPLACCDIVEVPVTSDDIPNGKWSGSDGGADLEEAIAKILNHMFANTVGLPTCSTTCPDGTPAEAGECVADVYVKRPISTTPSDYGVTKWETVQRGDLLIVLDACITQLPDGMVVNQECTPCEDGQQVPDNPEPQSPAPTGQGG